MSPMVLNSWYKKGGAKSGGHFPKSNKGEERQNSYPPRSRPCSASSLHASHSPLAGSAPLAGQALVGGGCAAGGPLRASVEPGQVGGGPWGASSVPLPPSLAVASAMLQSRRGNEGGGSDAACAPRCNEPTSDDLFRSLFLSQKIRPKRPKSFKACPEIKAWQPLPHHLHVHPHNVVCCTLLLLLHAHHPLTLAEAVPVMSIPCLFLFSSTDWQPSQDFPP